MPPAGRTRFVGREEEMATLREALRQAVVGQGQLVLVSGEPGIGKSFLASALAREAAEQGLRVAVARAPETGGTPPYWLWTETLRSLLGADAAPAARTPRSPLGALTRILPELATAGRKRAPSSLAEPEAERFLLAEDITNLLVSRAGAGACVLVLDDLHAADSSSLDVLAHLGARLSQIPMLVVGTHRDSGIDMTPALESFLARASRQERTSRIQLAGFDVHTVRRQLAGIFEQDIDISLAASVQERTGGNPFFTAELALLQQQIPEQRLAGPTLPPRVRDVIVARLRHLPADTRDVLEVAAMIGQEVPVDILARACRRSAVSVLAALDPAERSAWLRRTTSSRTLRFAHALAVEAIVQAVPLSRAAALHDQIATAIERMRSETLNDWLPSLARHWAAAEPTPKAARRTVEVARLAAEQAQSRLAFGDAIALWRTALEASGAAQCQVAARAELRLGLARSLFRLGDVAAAVDEVAHAARDAEACGRDDLLGRAALVLEGVSEPQWAASLLSLSERALDGLRAGEPALRARLHAQVGQLLYVLSREPDRARHQISRAVELAESSDDSSALQAALRAQQLVSGTPEGVHDRLRNAERMTLLGGESGDPWPELWGRLWSIDALAQLGRLDEAEVELQGLEPVVTRLRWPVARWHLLRERAAVLEARGRFEEALQAADEALAQLSGGGLSRAERMHVTFVESVADLVGDVPGADERLRRMREWAPAEPGSLLRLIVSLLRDGQPDEARALYARVPPLEQWHPPPYVVVVPLTWRLVAAIRLDRRDDVAALLARFEPFARWHVAHGSGAFVTLGSGYLFTGMAAAFLGDLGRAVSDLSRAVDDNMRCGALAMAVVARQELAEALVRRRAGTDLDRARRLASAVARDAQRLGMRPNVERASALLRGLPRRLVKSAQLTPREREIAGLVADGLTNRQLAVRVGISERTAESHLEHIRSKLGFIGRAQIAAWVGAGAAATGDDTSSRAP